MSKQKTLINPLSGFFTQSINSFLKIFLLLLIPCGLEVQAAGNNEMNYELWAHQVHSQWSESADILLAANTDRESLQMIDEGPHVKEELVSVTADTSLPYDSFNEETDWVDQIWGRPSRDHLYLGMWTFHLEGGDDQESNNKLIALSYKGYYGATLINTHCDRVWSGGVQRTLYQQKYGEFDIEAGYRAGIVYGYKEYLSRVFPLVQAILDIDYEGFGVELSYAAVVFSAGFYYRF
ncbi:hypothetical protein [Endozoicomonas sp. 8E]|uniref:hypothetical protein n=1 Tax=Endozoicomonas sp. 8E TaxID=3035692 RepID=UPI00293941CC|nr:hypothetical protein [Endozoicomonas sp. 8E]WOG28649.1 hypothetical protein P6910_03040 [Endozoicomonas sp. 8E]